MRIIILLVSFWVPFLIAIGLGLTWWISLIVGALACGTYLSYLKEKSKRSKEAEDLTVMEIAKMIM